MKKLPVALSVLLAAPAAMAKAVASYTVLADIVKHLGGEHVAVKSWWGQMATRTVLNPRQKTARRWRMPMWCLLAVWEWKGKWIA